MAGPKRKPVPASGQPTPDTIERADNTPASSTNETPTAPPAAEQTTGTSEPAATPPAPEQAAPADAAPALAADAAPALVETPAPAAPPEPAQDPEPAAEPAPAPVEARVLVAFGEHEVNDVITGSADEIEQMKLDGQVDPHPEAVAAARELRA